MSIYTGNGDSGLTELADGSRIAKADPKIEALGLLDELMCRLGWAACVFDLSDAQHAALASSLANIQTALFDVCAVAAACRTNSEAKGRMSGLTDMLESRIDELTPSCGPAGFIVPGGSEAAARLHLCRCACRTAERAVIRAWSDDFDPTALRLLNRLSDYLFVEACNLSVK